MIGNKGCYGYSIWEEWKMEEAVYMGSFWRKLKKKKERNV